MGADDLLEIGFGLEAEFGGALRVEAARPAGDDAGDQFVRLKIVLPPSLGPEIEDLAERLRARGGFDPRASLRRDA